MARRRYGKAIGARSARKLMREIGGLPAADLTAEQARVLGRSSSGFEVVRLADGRVLSIFGNSANLYESARLFLELLATIDKRQRRPHVHPLGDRFADGHSFVSAVPQLILDQKGRLVRAGLNSTRIIGHRPYHAGSTVDFDTKGNVTHVFGL